MTTRTDSPVDTVLQVADLHFWHVVTNPVRLLNKRFLGNLNLLLRRRREFPLERARCFAEAVVSNGARQVILTGDFSSTSIDEEFELAAAFVRGLKDSGLRVALVPGNHDVYTFESVRKRRFEQFFEEFLPEGGYPALVTLDGGTSLILAPTVCPNFLYSTGRITDAAVHSVRALLERCSGRTLVAGHYPLLRRTPAYRLSPGRRLRNAESLRQVLGNAGRPILYVCGHVHRFSYVRDPEFPSLEHLSTGAFFKESPRRKRQGEFSEIRVWPERFEVVSHYHEEQWKQETVSA